MINQPPPLPKVSKPWYKKWWAIALGMIFVLGTLGNLGDSGETVEAVGTTTTVAVTTTEAPTDTTAPAVTTTRAPTTTQPPSTELSNAQLRELWVLVVRDASSNDFPTDLTWADLMTDQEMFGILDIICELFDDAPEIRNDPTSQAAMAVLFAETTADDWWEDVDTELLAMSIGAASFEGVCP